MLAERESFSELSKLTGVVILMQSTLMGCDTKTRTDDVLNPHNCIPLSDFNETTDTFQSDYPDLKVTNRTPYQN